MSNLKDAFDDKEGMLDRIRDCKELCELNDWEEEFLDSLEEQVKRGRELTEKQIQKLEQIEDGE
jgi:hypothetical protein